MIKKVKLSLIHGFDIKYLETALQFDPTKQPDILTGIAIAAFVFRLSDISELAIFEDILYSTLLRQ